MARIRRYEFMGSHFYFWILCLTGILIPLAILYLINGTICVDENVDDAERVVAALRAKFK